MKSKQCVLHGKPIRMGEREITPEARLTWTFEHRAALGPTGDWGYGWAAVHLQPTAIIEQSAQRTRRIAMHDRTQELLWGLLSGALLLPFLMEAAVRLARPKRKA